MTTSGSRAGDPRVHRVCRYLKGAPDVCRKCDASEPDDGHGYGESVRGCYMLAAEVVALVSAAVEQDGSPQEGK